jgi:hypothetical protein
MKRTNERVLEYWSIIFKAYTKVSGSKIRKMARGSKLTRTEMSIGVHSWTISLTEKASTPGLMEKSMTVSGSKLPKMASVFGRVSRMTPIWESGETTRSGATESISGAMETSMRASGQGHSRMDRELITLRMRMFIQASTLTAALMAMDSTNGGQGLLLSVSSNRAWNTEKASGRKTRKILIAINILVTMRTTRNMDMDNSIGRVEIITLENTATTKGMVMERCIG